MMNGFGESTSTEPPNPSSSFSSNNNSDAGDFECNICFDLAQDPIITLCGHLFCWPCLYKWLRIHSRSHECPVCKALIDEEKLVPLYGRGKNSDDPRSKSIPGIEIPHRPAGQRPDTAPYPNPNADPFPQQGFGFMGGAGPFAPMATASLGNFTFSAGLGGLFPSFFNIQVNGFGGGNMYGAGPGFQYGYPNAFQGGNARGVPERGDNQQNQADSTLKCLLVVIALGVLLSLIWT